MPDQRTCSQCDRPVYCKAMCSTHYQRAYREKNAVQLAEYRSANAERRKAGWDAWHAANAAHRQAYRAQYNAANKERNIARYRANYAKKYATDPEPLRERARKFRAANPDKIRAHEERRRSRVQAQFIEKVYEDVLRARDGDTCGICTKPIVEKGSIDHIIPIWRGGEHSYANTRLVHVVCNKRRGGRDSAVAREALSQQ